MAQEPIYNRFLSFVNLIAPMFLGKVQQHLSAVKITRVLAVPSGIIVSKIALLLPYHGLWP